MNNFFVDQVYTSLSDGRILRITEDNYEVITFIDPENNGLEKCQSHWYATHHCARPLGLRFDSKGILYTVDPYHGLFKVNVNTGEYELIMDLKQTKLPDGKAPRFLDDLVLYEKPNGHLVVYMSDASTRWDLYDVFYMVGEHDSTGRILSYDTETKKIQIEAENLSFPNGLEWIEKKSAILIAEINNRRILKLYISGPNKGKIEVFTDRLPGEPDNIKRSQNPDEETYWIGLFSARNKHFPSLSLDFFAKYPLLRRFFFRLTRLTGFVLESIAKVVQNDKFLDFAFEVKISSMLNAFASEYGMGVEVDSKGRIINSLHSPDGRTRTLSEVFEYKRTETEQRFYLGSFSNKYLGRLVLPRQKKSPVNDSTPKVSNVPKTTTTKASEPENVGRQQTAVPQTTPTPTTTSSAEKQPKRSHNQHQEL